MDATKQKLLIEYLLASPDTFALCTTIVQPEYFDPEFRNSVKFIQKYYEQYNSLPSLDQVTAESGNEFKKQNVTHDQVEYCSNEIESFCKQKAIEHAIMASVPLMQDAKYGEIEKLIKDAITISLNRDLGLNYFEDPMARLLRMENESERLSTGWKEVDELLFGGHARKELLIFSANSGIGKSVTLANYGLNQAEMGRSVLYISLELSEELIAQRYDTMISHVETVKWKKHKERIVQAIEQKAKVASNITVKRMNSGTTARDIRGYLKEFELKNGYIPDILIVDYLDLMSSNERVSADNVFEKDKRSAEQLRDIGNDYNMAVASASQQNRSAVDEIRISQSHVAGGISKVNTADTWISIIATEAMKSQGECRFQFIKTRTSNGVGKMVTLKWLPNIRLVDSETPSIQTFVQQSQSGSGRQTNSMDAIKNISKAAADTIGVDDADDILGAFDLD